MSSLFLQKSIKMKSINYGEKNYIEIDLVIAN